MAFQERKHPRASTGCTASFRLGDHRYAGFMVPTIGAGGCSIAIPPNLRPQLQGGPLLEELHLREEGLPDHELRGRVAWMAGRDPLVVGVEFLEVPSPLARAIGERVIAAQEGTQAGY